MWELFFSASENMPIIPSETESFWYVLVGLVYQNFVSSLMLLRHLWSSMPVGDISTELFGYLGVKLVGCESLLRYISVLSIKNAPVQKLCYATVIIYPLS